MTKHSRKLAALAALSAGTLFQTGIPQLGCGRSVFDLALNTFDFCAVLNCDSGSFFDFCSPVAILTDCPNIVNTNDNTTP